jgi:chromosome segregation ATPase
MKKEDVRIGMGVDGAEETGAKVATVTAKLGEMGGAGPLVAQRLEELSTKARASLARLDDGGKVSQSNFDALAAKADAITTTVATAFGSIEAAPEEFRQAVELADQQVRDLSTAMETNAKKTERLREEYSRTTNAAEDFGVAIDATADALKALEEEQEQAAELAKKVADKFGDTAEKIDDIKKASDQTFPDQEAALKRIESELTQQVKAHEKLGDVGGEAVRTLKNELFKVETALKEVGAAGAAGLGRVRDATITTDRAFEEFSNALRTNPKEAAEQFGKLVGAVVSLRNEIKKLEAEGGPVSQEQLDKLKQYEARMQAAGLEANQLKREIDQTTTAVAGSAGAWTGLDAQLEGAIGKLGKVGVAMLGAAAAMKESWSIGMQLNQVFGTDMSEWEKTVERFGAKVNAIIKAVSDSAVNTGRLLVAVAKGDVEEIQKAFNDLNDSGNALIKAQKEALTKYGADWDALHPKIDAATEKVKEHKTAVEEAIGSIESMTGALDKQNAARRTGVDLLENEIALRENERRGNEQAALHAQAATKVQAGLSESMRNTINNLRDMIPAWDENTAKVDDMNASLRADIELYEDGISPAHEKRLRELTALLAAYEVGDTATKARVASMIEEILKWKELDAATVKATGSLQDGTATIEDGAKSTVKLTTALDTGKKSMEQTGEAANKLAAGLDAFGNAITNETWVQKLRQKLQDVDESLTTTTTTKALALTKAFNELAEAAARAAGAKDAATKPAPSPAAAKPAA